MTREIKFNFVYQHPVSKEVRISKSYTIEELLVTYDEEIYNTTIHCDCTSVGETNVVECGNGCDYFDEFVLIGKIQFTGMKDKYGVEIYEGDLMHVEYSHGQSAGANPCRVVWEKGSFGFRDKKDFWQGQVDSHCALSEVIGDIYRNPEQMK